MVLCITEPDFFGKKKKRSLKNGRNGLKIGFFEFIGNFSRYFFLVWSIKKVCIIFCIMILTGILVFSESDCRIFKLTTSLEQNNEGT